MKFCSIYFALLLFFLKGNAQFDTYPQGYFANPLQIPISLSGNFGELRNNHYHMGLDFRTGGRVNLPVYAAADGFISRIKVEPVGFGQSISIDHPNGFTSLYAHLNGFTPEIEKWVKSHQYKESSWKITLYPEPKIFPVKKGMLIGYSGNTGGSQAPHLHFEIRRTYDEACLNPLLFGFPLQDHQLPRILRMAVYDRTRSTYEQSPELVSLKLETPGNYQTIPTLVKVKSPLISLAFSAFDSEDGSSNLNGIAAASLWVDGVKKISLMMDQIGYENTRYFNAHIDYRTRISGGPWLQHLSALPGYRKSIYVPQTETGILSLKDGLVHDILIEVTDAYGNTAKLHSTIQWDGTNSQVSLVKKEGRIFYPGMMDVFESSTCEFFIGENALYDIAFVGHQSLVALQGAVSELHQIGAKWIPLQDSILIRLKPLRILSPLEKDRMIMSWTNGIKKAVQKVEWQGTWAGARFRDFGNFQLIIDTIPPRIVPLNFKDGTDLSKSGSLIFSVKDNHEKIEHVNTYLDGKWLRFSNDKNLAFLYRMDENFPAGLHELKIEAVDVAGNASSAVFYLKR